MGSFPVEEDTNQGSSPGGKKKIAGNPKNSGKVPACGTCGWFGPSYQGVVAVVANTQGSGVSSASLAEVFFLQEYYLPHVTICLAFTTIV